MYTAVQPELFHLGTEDRGGSERAQLRDACGQRRAAAARPITAATYRLVLRFKDVENSGVSGVAVEALV